MRNFLLIICLCLVSCCSKQKRHFKYIAIQEKIFNVQKYGRRYTPCVQETEAYFSFTNRLGQRIREPIVPYRLVKVMIEYYGTNITSQVIDASWEDALQGRISIDNANSISWTLLHKQEIIN